MKNFSDFFQSINNSTPNLRGGNTDPVNIGGTSNINNNFGNDLNNLLGNLNQGGNLRGSSIIPNNFGGIIYGLINKWYLLIVGPAMFITYQLFKALENHHVFDILYNSTRDVLNDLMATSSKCFDKINDVAEFFRCL